jgi:hypothetical protein
MTESLCLSRQRTNSGNSGHVYSLDTGERPFHACGPVSCVYKLDLTLNMKLFILVLLAFTVTGCRIQSSSYKHSGHNLITHTGAPAHPPAHPDQLVFVYRVEGSNAIFDSDKLTLIFPGVPKRQRDAFAFKSGFLAIQIAGHGVSESTVNSRRNFTTARFHSRYENGTNTITFCGRQVLLSAKNEKECHSREEEFTAVDGAIVWKRTGESHRTSGESTDARCGCATNSFGEAPNEYRRELFYP